MTDQNNTTADKAQTEASAPAAAKTDAKPQAAAQPSRQAPAAKRAKAKRPAKTRTVARKAKPAKVARTRKSARADTIVSKGAKTMINQTRTANEANLYAAEQFKTVFGDVNNRAKVAAERSAKIVEEMADLTRGNVEAFVASSKVAAKAVETMSQDAAEYSRKSFEDASSALKSFASAKSATDFFRLQSDFARSAFDSAVAESARMSESVLRIAGDVAQPITNRYTVAAERVKTLAA